MIDGTYEGVWVEEVGGGESSGAEVLLRPTVLYLYVINVI
jgi:hypothetical protein